MAIRVFLGFLPFLFLFFPQSLNGVFKSQTENQNDRNPDQRAKQRRLTLPRREILQEEVHPPPQKPNAQHGVENLAGIETHFDEQKHISNEDEKDSPPEHG